MKYNLWISDAKVASSVPYRATVYVPFEVKQTKHSHLYETLYLFRQYLICMKCSVFFLHGGTGLIAHGFKLHFHRPLVCNTLTKLDSKVIKFVVLSEPIMDINATG